MDGLAEFLRHAERDLEHATACCVNADVEVEVERQRDLTKKKDAGDDLQEYDRFRRMR